MEVIEITINEDNTTTIKFSDGSNAITYLDSRCVENLTPEQYNSLVEYIETEPEIYFNILNEIKSKI